MNDGNATLSLCMIVKDGAEFLERCLQSVHSIVPEIVVVDTGSTDKSMEIAAAMGARVYHHPWNDDFSAARNHALTKATGDWILFLDADEELDPHSVDELKQLIRNADVPAYYINIISARSGNGTAQTVINSLPRLFKNNIGIRYEGRVHEQIFHSLERIGAAIGFSDIKIIHHGYNLGNTAESAKLQRNLKLLNMELTDNPHNAVAMFHLGETCSLLHRPQEAMEAYQSALINDNLPDYLKPTAFQNYGTALYNVHRYEDALQALNQALNLKHDLYLAYLISALIYLKVSQPEQAITQFETLNRIYDRRENEPRIKYEILPDMAYVYTIMAHTYKQIDRLDHAAKYYQKAIKENSQFYDTYIGFADVLFSEKQYQMALKHYQQAYLLGVREPSIFIKLMQCYFEMGKRKKAMEMIQPLILDKKSIVVSDRYRSLVELAQAERRQ